MGRAGLCRSTEPRPRFVPAEWLAHSELTTAVQIADLVAYLVAWGVRVGSMEQPCRPELA